MKTIARRIWNEPAITFGIPTICFGLAAGVWTEPWLGFAAALSAGLGTLFTRQNSTPLGLPSDRP